MQFEISLESNWYPKKGYKIIIVFIIIIIIIISSSSSSSSSSIQLIWRYIQPQVLYGLQH